MLSTYFRYGFAQPEKQWHQELLLNFPLLSSNISYLSTYDVPSLSLYDRSGFTPRMSILLWRSGIFQVSESDRNTSWKALNRHSESFMVYMGDLIQQYKVPPLLNGIRTLDHLHWHHNWSDFSSISWPWYRAWPSPKYKWFQWSIFNWCGIPAGNAYHFEHMIPSPLLGTCLFSSCWDQLSRIFLVFTRLFSLDIPWYFLDNAGWSEIHEGEIIDNIFFHLIHLIFLCSSSNNII